MSQYTSRSDQVIEDYKKHKLAASAMHRVQALIRSFENERLTDRRLARFGLPGMLLLIGVSTYILLSGKILILP